MPWGAIAASVVGSVLSNRDRKRAKKDQINSFSRIRKGAEKAGFNPLTALGSAAAGGFGNLPSGTMAPLASAELAQNALRGVADIATGEKARRDNAQDVQDRIQRLKLERLEAGNAGEIAARTRGAVVQPTAAKPVTYGLPLGIDKVRPRGRPTLQSEGSIPVFAPDGTQFSLPRAVADRLRLDSWDAVIAGDLTEILGEIPGELANAAAAININSANGSPLWQKKTTPSLNPSTNWGSSVESGHAPHQNPDDMEAIRKNRYGKEN